MNEDCNLIFFLYILTGLQQVVGFQLGTFEAENYFDPKICGRDRLEVNGGRREGKAGHGEGTREVFSLAGQVHIEFPYLHNSISL